MFARQDDQDAFHRFFRESIGLADVCGLMSSTARRAFQYFITFTTDLSSVDAKINTLESEGKCLPSSGKSTKRANQFDLQLIRDKQKLNSRAYQLEF